MVRNLDKVPQGVERSSLHDEVVGRLRDMIVEGKLPAGSHVPERRTCEQLGISRTPLREAYKVLASEGLLLLVPNRGAMVVRLTLEMVEDIMEVLAALEGLAAGLACARITEEELREIEALHDEMLRYFRAGELMDYFKTNQAIHDAIVCASGNSALLSTYRSLGARIRRFRYLGNRESSRWERAVKEHEQILMALADRDGPLLTQVLQSHLRNGWVLVRDLVSDELKPDEARSGLRAAG